MLFLNWVIPLSYSAYIVLDPWGATAAANAGVNDRLFKRHGRWRSDKAKDGYVKDNLEALLSVSKSLEI